VTLASSHLFPAVLLHHMVPKNGNDLKFLEKGLVMLKPMFRKLIANNKTRIVWKNQAPTPWGAHESDAKVPHYNQRVGTILK